MLLGGEMKRVFDILIAFSFIASCSPKPEDLALYLNQTLEAIPTQTDYPTQTAYPTHTAYPSLTPVNTYTPVFKLVTATFTVTPEFTSTETNTPTITLTNTPTLDPLKRTRGNGFYLIGVDIAPGVWRSDGTQDDCYWAVTRANGDIIDNHFGMAGGTAYLPASGFQVQFEDCGTWSWLSN